MVQLIRSREPEPIGSGIDDHSGMSDDSESQIAKSEPPLGDEEISRRILTIRGQDDFMFLLTEEEYLNLRSQFVTSSGCAGSDSDPFPERAGFENRSRLRDSRGNAAHFPNAEKRMRSPSKESPLPSESFPSYRQSSPTPTGSNFSKSDPAISSSTLRTFACGDRSVFDPPFPPPPPTLAS